MNLPLLSFWCVKGHCIQACIVYGLRGYGGYVDGVYDCMITGLQCTDSHLPLLHSIIIHESKQKNSRSKHLDSLVALNPMVRAANPEKTVWRIGLKVREYDFEPV